MSLGEFLQFGSLIALVMVIAYVARRSQRIGVPPGVSKETDNEKG